MAAVTDFRLGDTCVFTLDPCLTLMSAILILYFTNVSRKTLFFYVLSLLKFRVKL